jgi:hypothetical protein
MSPGIEALEERRLLAFPLGFGSTGADVGNAVATDRAGNTIVVGQAAGAIDFDPGAGDATLPGGGAFVAKYDSTGALVWARQFTGATAVKVATDRDNAVYLAGSFSGTVDFNPRRSRLDVTSGGGTDAFLVKLTTSGNLDYARTFGGKADDAATGLAVTTDSRVWLGGTFAGRADFNPESGVASIGNSGGDDGFIVALDDGGHYRWAGSFAGPNDEVVADLALDDDDNVLATGQYRGAVDFDPTNGDATTGLATTPQAYALKWDADGGFVWMAGFGGVGTTYGTSIAADRSGNVYTTGNFDDVADFDPGAATSTLTAPPSGQVFVSKLDPSKAFVFARALGGASATDTGPGEIAVDKDGNIYTTGRFTGTKDFDPGAGTQNLTSAGSFDVFVSKLNSAGNFVFARGLGGPGVESAVGSILDRNGDILTTGSFDATADFDPSGGTSNLTTIGSDDVFVSRLTSGGVIV